MEKEYFYVVWNDWGIRLSHLNTVGARFIDYVRDEAGTPIGIKMSYDGGQGYGYDHSDSRVELYPGPEVNLPYMYSIDIDDDDWFDNEEIITVELRPLKEPMDFEEEQGKTEEH
ncbi:MAG: hypothetical protein LUE22_10465 [Oscillospiraceae bacterium]|nr:hypothetical protein [Oscillospiraceae bacterium]